MVARDTMWLSITWSSEVTSSTSHLAHDPKSIDWFSNEDQSRLFFFCFFCFCLHQHIFFLLDLHPCIGIECEKFAHCVEISPYEYTCQCNTSSSTHTVKYTCNSQLTMSIIRMLLLFTKLLQLGLKALTPLSLQPVSLEQEEMTTLQTVLLRLIGLHIKVLPQEEFLVKNCFPFGELGLFVKQLLFPA